jgi:hypothetical protein
LKGVIFLAVSTDLNKHIYVGNGTNKTWSVSFRLLQAADLKLYLTNITTSVITEITTNYSISPTGGTWPADTATITYPSSGDAISSDYNLTLVREVDITQTTVYPNNTALKPKVVEKDLDKGVMIDQQLSETLARCIKTPISDTGTLDTDEYISEVRTSLAASQVAQAGAETAETNAKESELAAAASATAAAQTETYTLTVAAANTAITQAGIATDKAILAATSEVNALASKNASAISETNAASSANAANLAAQNIGSLAFTTVALMNADLAHAADTICLVTNDPTATNNGQYIKLDASGSGSWQKSAYVPPVVDLSVTTSKLSAAAYGKPYILPGLTLPNYDTATKTLSFNSDATYKTMLFYKNTCYQIPVDTTVVDGNSTSAVQLIFDTSTNTFSFIPYSTELNENQVRVAVYKRYASFYQWDFPCDLTIDNKLMALQNYQPYGNLQKALISYAYIGYGHIPEIVEGYNTTYVLFRLPYDASTIAVRPPGGGYSITKTWPDIKSALSSYVVTVDSVDYISIPDGYAFVANGIDGTIEIVSLSAIVPGTHIILVVCAGGKARGLYGYLWKNQYDHSLIDIKITDLETITGKLPDYAKTDITATQEKIANLTSNNTLNFVFVTDTHADGTYYDQIQNHFRAILDENKYGVADFICVGGDITGGYETDKATTKTKLSTLMKILTDAKRPVLVLNGNHDDNSYYTTSGSVLATNVITKQEWYSRVLSPFNNDEIHDTQLPTSRYYFKDFATKKVRAVFLDSSDHPETTNESGILVQDSQSYWGFGLRQCEWLATEALANLPMGYKVLVLSHMPTRAALNAYSTGVQYGSEVEGILKACHTGTSYSGGVTVDFTSQGARSILAYVHGHTHADLISKPSDLGWNYISVACSLSSAVSSETVPSGATIPTRTAGTDTEDCWDVITINVDTNAINCTRYGAGSDRTAN